jgi:hypothetical protein
MNLRDSLQVADVAIWAVSLLVATIGTYLFWHTTKGIPLRQDPLCHGGH